MRLALAYLLNHPPLPHKWELRRILETGEPDLSIDYVREEK